MIKVVLLLIVSFGVPLAEAKGGKAHPMRKIDTTPKFGNDLWSFSFESNIYDGTMYANPVLDYSIANGWDVQIAAYNMPVYGGGVQNFEYDSYINLSKTFELTRDFKAVFGTQNGTTLFSSLRQLHNVEYALSVYQPSKGFNVHAGVYWANKALTTTTDYLGYTVGYNVELVHNTLAFSGDYYSGHNNLSGAVVNLWYMVTPKTSAYLGVGIPETDSGNDYYGIVGISTALN